MCIMDTDTGVDGVLQESGEFCGTIGDYHHGKKPPESRYFYDYICDNIDAEEYVEITREECVTIKGLAEGTGPDNPRLWDDVWMTPAAQNSCADYDKCPASGTSGFCRGPGDKMCDIIKCPGQTSTKAGAGLYSSSSRLTSRLRGKPFRYTMPKFVCFTYPAGSSSFTLTYTVGGNPGAPPYYGRNFMFGGTSIEKQCADPQAASLRSSTCKDCQFEFSLDAEGPCPLPTPSSSYCPIVGESILSESLPAGVKCLDVTCSAGRRRRLQSESPTVTLTVMLEAPSAAAIESVEARLSELMSSIAAASTLLGIRVITLPVFRPDYTGRRITSDEYAGLVVGCAVGGVAALALLGLGVRHALRRAQVRPAVQKAGGPPAVVSSHDSLDNM